mmetsp:Transcript_119680/g.338817  ORF Transcript_119680/g.338817 Transcript_119680/m.338817 type:complete len:233 (-) Transcript_119680:651-1349(-)
MRVPWLSLMPSAISRTALESRQFDSTLSRRSVVFLRRAPASSKPWALCMFAFDSNNTSMCVFQFMASMSFGAMRFSTCAGGMCMLEKSNTSNEGSLSHARWTIQIIQSPKARIREGSGKMSATLAISSIRDAKHGSIVIATACSLKGSWSALGSSKFRYTSARFRHTAAETLTRYVVSWVVTLGVPLMTPVLLSSVMPLGSAGCTENANSPEAFRDEGACNCIALRTSIEGS